MRTEVVGRTQIVVYGAPWSEMSGIQAFARDHGFDVVDARWRTSSKWFAIATALMFVCTGAGFFLVGVLLAGNLWARSYPHRDRVPRLEDLLSQRGD